MNPNPNLSEAHALRIISPLNEAQVDAPAKNSHPAAVSRLDDILTVEDARIALEAIQRINSKLETENASLLERVELLDQLVVKLLKQNDRLANKS